MEKISIIAITSIIDPDSVGSGFSSSLFIIFVSPCFVVKNLLKIISLISKIVK